MHDVCLCCLGRFAVCFMIAVSAARKGIACLHVLHVQDGASSNEGSEPSHVSVVFNKLSLAGYRAFRC